MAKKDQAIPVDWKRLEEEWPHPIPAEMAGFNVRAIIGGVMSEVDFGQLELVRSGPPEEVVADSAHVTKGEKLLFRKPQKRKKK